MRYNKDNIKLAIITALLFLFGVLSTTHLLQRCAVALFAPFSTVVSAVGTLFANGIRVVIPGAGSSRRHHIAELEKENLEMRIKLSEHALSEQTYRQLRSSSGLPVPPPWKALASEIILRQPERWNEIMTLNRGSADGVKLGSVALLPSGYVLGRIISCERHHSILGTVLAPECQFGVMLRGERLENSGLMMGDSPSLHQHREHNDCFIVDFLPKECQAAIGDTVVTSGLGGIMPSGLEIGKVVSQLKVKNALQGELLAKPYATFGMINIVFVIVPAK